MSVGSKFINCKKNKCRIDLGYENPVKADSVYIVQGRLNLKVVCPKCKAENFYDLHTDLHAI